MGPSMIVDGDAEIAATVSIEGEASMGPSMIVALDRKTGNVYIAVAGFGPRPAPTPDKPAPRPPILPGTFNVLVMGK